MSKTLKMVFAAFMQHCIQSTVTHLNHVEGVKDVKYYCTLYTVASHPCQEGRLFLWSQQVQFLAKLAHPSK